MNSALQGLLLVYTNGGITSAPPQGLIDSSTATRSGSRRISDLDRRDRIGDFGAELQRLRRKLYAVGTNSTAAFLAGVMYGASCSSRTCLRHVRRHHRSAPAGFLGQAFINIGDEYLFSSAVAVAVGGASSSAGAGTTSAPSRGRSSSR